MSSIYQFTVKDLHGKDIRMDSFKGKVLLIVNTASECGFTPQYKGLEQLYRKYKDKGFVVLGFPSNDFGRQEPLEGDAIKKFCEENYDVTFPLFEKIHVKGIRRIRFTNSWRRKNSSGFFHPFRAGTSINTSLTSKAAWLIFSTRLPRPNHPG